MDRRCAHMLLEIWINMYYTDKLTGILPIVLWWNNQDISETYNWLWSQGNRVAYTLYLGYYWFRQWIAAD